MWAPKYHSAIVPSSQVRRWKVRGREERTEGGKVEKRERGGYFQTYYLQRQGPRQKEKRKVFAVICVGRSPTGPASPSMMNAIYFLGGAHSTLSCLLCGLKTPIRTSPQSQFP